MLVLTCREFTLAEIEHFCHPEDKSHPKFSNVADTVMCLYSACNQMDGKGAEQRTIGDAVKSVRFVNFQETFRNPQRQTLDFINSGNLDFQYM